CNCAQTPPTPDPSPPLERRQVYAVCASLTAAARGGRGAERPVVSLSRCVHALARQRGPRATNCDARIKALDSRLRGNERRMQPELSYFFRNGFWKPPGARRGGKAASR